MNKNLFFILTTIILSFFYAESMKAQETNKGYAFNCSNITTATRGVYSFDMGETMTNVQCVGPKKLLKHVSGAVMRDDRFYYFNWTNFPYTLCYCTVSDTTEHVVKAYNDYISIEHFAYNKYNHKTYCVSLGYDEDTYDDVSYLHTIDLDNGKIDTVCHLVDENAGMTIEVQGLAVNSKGNMYIIDVYGTLYNVNYDMGTCTSIGVMDYNPDGVFYYSNNCLFFDDNTGKLYFRMETSKGGNELVNIDIETAAVTQINKLNQYETLDGIAIICEDTPADGIPGKVENLTAVPAEYGTLEATLEWDNPTLTSDGTTLSDIISISIIRNGIAVAEIYECKPGEHKSWTDSNIESNGLYEYSVSVINKEGNSEEESIKIYVGKGIPMPPTNVELEGNGNTAILTWTVPEKGEYDSYIDPEDLTFDITRYPDNKIVATDLKTYDFVDNNIEVLQKYYYEICAKTKEGNSKASKSNEAIIGPALTIPCEFLFEDKSTMDIWTVIDANNNGNSWTWNKGYNGEITGPVMMYAYDNNTADDWLISPRLNLESNKEYKVSFDASSSINKYTNLEITLGNNAEIDSQQTIKKLVVEGNEITTYEIILENIEENGDYHIGFHCITSTLDFYLRLGNIKIEKYDGSNIDETNIQNEIIKIWDSFIIIDPSYNVRAIYNIAGIQQEFKQLDSKTYDINSLPNGIYIVNLDNGKKPINIKILKQ